jgi:hypothetical protein
MAWFRKNRVVADPNAVVDEEAEGETEAEVTVTTQPSLPGVNEDDHD